MAKCKEFLPSYVKFYIQNVCHIRKNRIEVRANLVARTDAHEAASLATDDWHDAIVDIIGNSNNKSDNDYTNIDLAEFKINTKILLADSIREIYCR